MFACIYSLSQDFTEYPKLFRFASQFSPLIEETSQESVTVDLKGTELLNGDFSAFPEKAVQKGIREGLFIRTAVAANPDAAFHAARGLEKSTYIPAGREHDFLKEIPVEKIFYESAGVSSKRFQEILLTLNMWGIYNFGQLAALPASGLSERLGPEGVRIQQLARGTGCRSIIVKPPEADFCRTMRFEYPISDSENLVLAICQILTGINEELDAAHLAAAGLEIGLDLTEGNYYERRLEFPSPVKDYKILKKIIDLEISGNPPQRPVLGIKLKAVPGKSRIVQSGFFIPDEPQPQKTELVIAKIGKIVGQENIGIPAIEDSHHPDPFRIDLFQPVARSFDADFPEKPRKQPACRKLRPPLTAQVWTSNERPVRIKAAGKGVRNGITGNVVVAAGPWNSSGGWWSEENWDREEWDLQLLDGTLCRIYRDLHSNRWFIDALYD